MKMLKMLFMGLLVGLIIGLWFGINMGKQKPIFSNPFAEENLQKKLKVKVGERIEKLGGDIKGNVKESK